MPDTNSTALDVFIEMIDPKEELDKHTRIEWLGVWMLAWQMCVRTLSPSQISADLETARRGLADYRATIERMVAEKEEMAGKLAELAPARSWVTHSTFIECKSEKAGDRVTESDESVTCPVCRALMGDDESRD